MQNERNDREEPNAAHCVYYNDYYYVGDGMREAKFTKGPWVVHLNKVGVVDTSDTQSYGMLDVVAVVDAWDFAKQHEHNAHLIAAAPELYEALTQLIDDLINTDEEGLFELSETVIRCRLALSKARGEI